MAIIVGGMLSSSGEFLREILRPFPGSDEERILEFWEVYLWKTAEGIRFPFSGRMWEEGKMSKSSSESVWSLSELVSLSQALRTASAKAEQLATGVLNFPVK